MREHRLSPLHVCLLRSRCRRRCCCCCCRRRRQRCCLRARRCRRCLDLGLNGGWSAASLSLRSPLCRCCFLVAYAAACGTTRRPRAACISLACSLSVLPEEADLPLASRSSLLSLCLCLPAGCMLRRPPSLLTCVRCLRGALADARRRAPDVWWQVLWLMGQRAAAAAAAPRRVCRAAPRALRCAAGGGAAACYLLRVSASDLCCSACGASFEAGAVKECFAATG